MAQTTNGSYALQESVGPMANLIESLTRPRPAGGVWLTLAGGGIINLDHVIRFYEVA